MALTQANLTQGSGLTVTNNVVTGTGVFDDLMEAVTTHLEAQYQLGRITGTDFATVYLGAMQSALQQSVAYTIGQEKTNAEVALLTQKQTTEFAQTLVTGNTTPNANSVIIGAPFPYPLTQSAGTNNPNGNASGIMFPDFPATELQASSSTIITNLVSKGIIT